MSGMTSQAPFRCVNNILITYDENKAKADIPTHSLNNIQGVPRVKVTTSGECSLC